MKTEGLEAVFRSEKNWEYNRSMALAIDNLKVMIEGKEVLKGVSLRTEPGEVVALMGPNGSGKSSLAYALMGHPKYGVSGNIDLDGISLIEKSADERAKMGLFLAFQYPVGIPGVKVREVLLTFLRSREETKAIDLKYRIEETGRELGIKEELLNRSLNDGFSGGEKKKMELLQMRIMEPKYAILDETDSGLDIDALKIVAMGARNLAKEKNTGLLVITHYQRLLKFLKPDRVVVMKEGKIVAEGGKELVEKLEKEGYEKV